MQIHINHMWRRTYSVALPCHPALLAPPLTDFFKSWLSHTVSPLPVTHSHIRQGLYNAAHSVFTDKNPLLSDITLLSTCVFCPHRKVRTCSEGSCFQVTSNQNNVMLCYDSGQPEMCLFSLTLNDHISSSPVSPSFVLSRHSGNH